MQTKESGKPDILPVAGQSPDHAVVPVMLPRDSDANMRPGEGAAAYADRKTPVSTDECTAHQDSHAAQGSHSRPTAIKRHRSPAQYRIEQPRRTRHAYTDPEEPDYEGKIKEMLCLLFCYSLSAG
jgi:hypothetical protein